MNFDVKKLLITLQIMEPVYKEEEGLLIGELKKTVFGQDVGRLIEQYYWELPPKCKCNSSRKIMATCIRKLTTEGHVSNIEDYSVMWVCDCRACFDGFYIPWQINYYDTGYGNLEPYWTMQCMEKWCVCGGGHLAAINESRILTLLTLLKIEYHNKKDYFNGMNDDIRRQFKCYCCNEIAIMMYNLL